MVNEWTRDDLPPIQGLLDPWGGHGLLAWAGHVLDSAVDHLNANGGVSSTEVDRWRRAHEIVERERDQAREQRAVAER